MIESRRTSEKLGDHKDLLSRLIQANEEVGKMQLTDEELLSAHSFS
jgi:cytochrome P450